jgi:hypothetical protein
VFEREQREKVKLTGSEPLVFPANENGRNNVANDKEQQKDVV